MVAPRQVVSRMSTDVIATGDPHVAKAVLFVRQYACEGIRVADVLRHVHLSRASLEPRFKQILGRTVHQQIQRVRLSRVRELLATTDMPIKQIARQAGYRYPRIHDASLPARNRPDPQAVPRGSALSAWLKKGSGNGVRNTLWPAPATVPDLSLNLPFCHDAFAKVVASTQVGTFAFESRFEVEAPRWQPRQVAPSSLKLPVYARVVPSSLVNVCIANDRVFRRGPENPGFRWKPSVHLLCKAQ